ncbi:MAG: hypothetical protein M3178_00965 [Pseudomonadota bacterium]|nr:hypothetical protein [Pseudomonadota bacterium]
MDARDRRAAILASTSFNGIDFVEIADPSQTTLKVHFLNDVTLGTLLSPPAITGGDTVPTVAVQPISDTDWSYDEGHLVLTLRVAAPGDFSFYTLTLKSDALDPFFDHVQFSFKALCPSDLDCKAKPPPCPPLAPDVPPIDYLAKDFLSFRQALLDFSALRYPQWQERSEADFGMMFLEALSAVADDLSYTQDRVAAEAALVTATQRRSVIRHARLVDYEPQPAISSSVMLQFDVAAGVSTIMHGLAVSAQGPDGAPIVFETGTSLMDRLVDPRTGALRDPHLLPSSPANSLWNAGKIKAYWFDDSQRCLKAGATQMYVLGHGYGFRQGQMLLIETQPESAGDPPIRQIVELAGPGAEECDWLFPPPDGAAITPPAYLTCPPSPPSSITPAAVTKIVWRDEDKLTSDRDLTRTTVAGNIVPATQGKTFLDEPFFITAAPPTDLTTPATIVRTGPRATLPDGTPGTTSPLQLYTLANGPLAWLPQTVADLTQMPVPEILLLEETASGRIIWSWFREILDAGEFDTAYTLDAARFRPILRNSDGSVHYEYDGDAGDTIRFGGNGFGHMPNDGTRFTVSYRIGNGAAGNVASDAITHIDPVAAANGLIAVTNPWPASGGSDPETLDSVRRFAPQEFRAQQFRAVLPADYAAAADTLPWVQRAGTVFRWTGSWLTVFTTPDPLNSEQITVSQRTGLIDLLNRYRMAGYESYVPDPKYVSIDLAIDLCAKADAFRGDVEAGVTAALDASKPSGFFHMNNFTFGQPLELSALEAAIQGVPGVAGITCVRYRVRGRASGWLELLDAVSVAADEIIRCDNDPSLPERGSFKISVMGGK